MKTFSLFKKVSLAASALFVIAAFAACGKSNGIARNNNPYTGIQNCPGCGIGGGNQNLGTAIGESFWMGSPQVEARLVLNLIAGGNQAGGTISANGRFDMQMQYATGCGVPPGAYQVTTIQQGQFGGTTFGNLTLLATGPSQVRIFIPQGAMSSIGGRLTGVGYMNYASESCKLYLQ
jgi:hypothetical protein